MMRRRKPRHSHTSILRRDDHVGALGRRSARGNARERIALQTEPLEARQLLAGDLVGYWLADQIAAADGDAISSWTGQEGLEASAQGSPTFVADAINGRAAVRLDPTDDLDGFRLRSAINPLSGANDFSVAVVFVTDSNNLLGGSQEWFKNSALVDSGAMGFATDWGTSINNAGQVAAGMGGGFAATPQTMYSTAGGLNDGQTHSLVVTRSGGTMSLYVDDQAVVTQNNFDVNPRNSLDVTWGMLQNNTNPFEGQIAQVRLYNGTLDANEVATLQSEINTYYSNSAPVAQDDQYALDEDPSLYFISAAQGVLKNDTDADGERLTAVLVTPPQHGDIVLNADGSFAYSPASDYFGPDSFTYTANDFRPSNIATVTFDIRPVYDPPVAQRDEYKAVPSQTLTVAAAEGVLANDRNIDNAVMTAVLEQDVSNGTLVLRPDGSFDYTAGGFSGVATFSYRASDGQNSTPPATVTLIVNTPPAPQDDQYAVDEDQTLTIDVTSGILANDVDADGNPLTLTLETETTNGTLDLADDGSFTYVPNADFFGEDQFTYSVSDGVDPAGPVTVHVTINPVNDPPQIVADAYVATSSRLDVDASRGVLSNDVDIDGPQLTAELVDGPSNGSLALQPNGEFIYQPNAGFTGQDRFTYRVNDSLATTEVAEVLIVIQPSTPNVANPTGDSIVTFNEIMYNPDGAQSRLEWVELRNQMGINMDISGWCADRRYLLPLPGRHRDSRQRLLGGGRQSSGSGRGYGVCRRGGSVLRQAG